MTEEEKPVYILYPDETADNWRVQAVPLKPESFESRKALPEACVFISVSLRDGTLMFSIRWRGLRDEELSETSGIPGGIFVHASGFTGGEFHFSLLGRRPSIR